MPEATYQRLREGCQRFEERAAHRPSAFREARTPKVLWIGCADGRDSPVETLRLEPEEVVVHRNLANLIIHTDLNCLSVLDYAVNTLKVEHVIVCGHYRCQKILAATSNQSHAGLDNWYGHIKDVYRLHQESLESLPLEERSDRLVELNVVEQVANLCACSIVQESWQERGLPQVHGWVFDPAVGEVKDLGITVKGLQDISRVYQYR